MPRLTAARRHALPKSDFAGPDESYPVDTKGRARAALSRGAHNAGPSLQAKIRRKVKRRYPDMKVDKVAKDYVS